MRTGIKVGQTCMACGQQWAFGDPIGDNHDFANCKGPKK